MGTADDLTSRVGDRAQQLGDAPHAAADSMRSGTREDELREMGREMADHMREPVQDAVETVKESAQDKAQELKASAVQGAEQVQQRTGRTEHPEDQPSRVS
jgi:hypothetical protein